MLNNEDFCEAADIGLGIRGKKIIVQGFGNVGSYTAKMLHTLGMSLIGVGVRHLHQGWWRLLEDQARQGPSGNE